VTAALKPGDVVRVDRAASVQFVAQPITFRIIKLREDLVTYHGWLWLDGYQLDEKGDAVERRTIFVRPAGLRPAGPPPTAPVIKGFASPKRRYLTQTP
jgi:hypothetical protein